MAHLSILKNNRHYRNGITLLDQGQFGPAAAEFEEVLAGLDEQDPSARLAKFHLGEARAHLGMEMLRRHAVERAELELRRALAINPGYADLHYNLARALASKGKNEEALAEIETAIKINPAFAKAYFERGLILCKSGAFHDGIQDIDRAVDMDPAYSRDLLDSARFLYDNDQPDAALHRLTELASTDFDDIDYYFQLGKDFYRRGQYSRAIVEFRKALNVHPGYADIRNYLGTALLLTGKPEEALREIEAALDINPRFVAATINAGDACAAMNDKNRAFEYYETALSLDPGNTDAAAKLAELQEA